MTLKLVPDTTEPTQPEKMSEEQLRTWLSSIHTPRLDELRQRLSTLKSSELIAWLANPALTAQSILEEDTPQDHVEAIVTAAMLALADEFDRRVPIPT